MIKVRFTKIAITQCCISFFIRLSFKIDLSYQAVQCACDNWCENGNSNKANYVVDMVPVEGEVHMVVMMKMATTITKMTTEITLKVTLMTLG